METKEDRSTSFQLASARRIHQPLFVSCYLAQCPLSNNRPSRPSSSPPSTNLRPRWSSHFPSDWNFPSPTLPTSTCGSWMTTVGISLDSPKEACEYPGLDHGAYLCSLLDRSIASPRAGFDGLRVPSRLEFVRQPSTLFLSQHLPSIGRQPSALFSDKHALSSTSTVSAYLCLGLTTMGDKLNPETISEGSRSKASSRGQGTNTDNGPSSKRRCVSTACIACRRRKSKCDGNLPSCAACSSVYHTTCVYDPNSDHRRKGVYKKDTDTLRTKNSTLLTLIQALLNYEEEDAFDLVRQIRSCDSLEDVAHSLLNQDRGSSTIPTDTTLPEDDTLTHTDQFESELAGKMSNLVLDGSRKFIGGTSNLIFLPPGSELNEFNSSLDSRRADGSLEGSVSQWTKVTDDEHLISHLMTMYFTWHYPFFTTLSKELFYRDYVRGVSSQYCSSLLVNSMLALGCHFSSWPEAREDPDNTATAGDHFFKEAKRLVLDNDELVNSKLCTVQALALMSVREAGCGREGKGWVYSGMSFRMALDLGLNLESTSLGTRDLSEEEVDARRITFWGCFLFDKCWSNYLGRQPQFATTNTRVPHVDILPNEESALWSPYTDTGPTREYTQPSRTRAVAVQLSRLCAISGDLLASFYDPTPKQKPTSKQIELKKLSEIHTRLEAWKKGLPKELESREGQLPQALLMHMFYQLLLIHLYRPFLKYTKSTTPLPQHVSPRKLCTQAAAAISKLLRLYKRTYSFKQICNIAVYIAHTALTIHLLNLPERNAQRDVIHGLRHLEEMGEFWLCARRTLRILDISANKWQVQLPKEAVIVLEQTHARWGSWGPWDQAASPSASEESPPTMTGPPPQTAATNMPPPTSRASSNQPTNTPIRSPAVLTAPVTSPFSSLPSGPLSLSAMRAAQRSLSAQLARTDTRQPEPTYLRPVSSAYSSAPSGHPSTQEHQWYGPSEAQIRAFSATHNVSTTSTSSPMTTFDAPDSLVEESQDWWSRDVNSLNLGSEDWAQGWSNNLTGASPDWRYDNNIPNIPPTSGSEPNFRPPQSVRVPNGVPPNLVVPNQGPNVPDNNSSTMAFPGSFQQ
ncbi:putative C6 transcription factor (NirA) [Aspergillus lucknowensis]|uniref:Fungal-specific transcription factor domain-containing protein n=1 Tax=Aspergillus lucknowensis TaxID=176173 RepID=A0ABR4LJI4_9EURO